MFVILHWLYSFLSSQNTPNTNTYKFNSLNTQPYCRTPFCRSTNRKTVFVKSRPRVEGAEGDSHGSVSGSPDPGPLVFWSQFRRNVKETLFGRQRKELESGSHSKRPFKLFFKYGSPTSGYLSLSSYKDMPIKIKKPTSFDVLRRNIS